MDWANPVGHHPERGPSTSRTGTSQQGRNVALTYGGRVKLTDMDIVRAIFADAKASNLTLDDLIEAAEHADCLMCFDDAVSMLGIGAIDTTQFKFELTFKG